MPCSSSEHRFSKGRLHIPFRVGFLQTRAKHAAVGITGCFTLAVGGTLLPAWPPSGEGCVALSRFLGLQELSRPPTCLLVARVIPLTDLASSPYHQVYKENPSSSPLLLEEDPKDIS